MNKLLESQLIKVFGSMAQVPPGLDVFLKLVSEAYDRAEEDRHTIEHTMKLSSKELAELSAKTHVDSQKLQEALIETERINKLMIDRELKMIELKEQLARLQGELPA